MKRNDITSQGHNYDALLGHISVATGKSVFVLTNPYNMLDRELQIPIFKFWI